MKKLFIPTSHTPRPAREQSEIAKMKSRLGALIIKGNRDEAQLLVPDALRIGISETYLVSALRLELPNQKMVG